MSSQTIGHDKLNQLRHVQYFKTPENIRRHMADLAEVLRPKFDMVLNRLEEELEGSGLAVWSRPKGAISSPWTRLQDVQSAPCSWLRRQESRSQAQAQPIPTRGIRRTEISALLPPIPRRRS